MTPTARTLSFLFLSTSIIGAVLSLVVTGLMHRGAALDTVHGLLMMAFTLVPAMTAGLGLGVLPRQLGVAQVAFPRVALLGWVLHAAALLMAGGALVFGSGAAGIGALVAMGLSMLAVAVVTLTTVIAGRAVAQVPIFASSLGMTAAMTLLAVPTVAAAALVTATPPAALAHPLVFLLLVPALGILTEVVGTFARAPLPRLPVLATLGAIAGLGTVLWMQELYSGAVDAAFLERAVQWTIPPVLLVIGLWGVALRHGLRAVASPLLWVAGFVLLTLGGSVLAVGIDGTARFHYALGLGSVFAAFGGFYLWLPVLAQRRAPEGWAAVHAVAMFAGANLSFLTPLTGGADALALAGSALSFATFAGFLWVMARTLRNGEVETDILPAETAVRTV